MSVEERHLLNKIRFFEDMLLRSKDYRQQENMYLRSQQNLANDKLKAKPGCYENRAEGPGIAYQKVGKGNRGT